jgi:hypothetical protein
MEHNEPAAPAQGPAPNAAAEAEDKVQPAMGGFALNVPAAAPASGQQPAPGAPRLGTLGQPAPDERGRRAPLTAPPPAPGSGHPV